MKYSGRCHCGKVQFEVESETQRIIACNCSHCEKKGLLLDFVPETQFSLLSGQNELTEYLFNKKTIKHLFCRTCGVQPIGKSKKKDGQEMVAVNVRCLEGIDLAKLTVTPFNGRDI